MGIVAHCPNGHRVKVKDHLAGKRGICPTCGAKFRIASEPDLPVARFVPVDPAVAATLPRAVPFGTARDAAQASRAVVEAASSAAGLTAATAAPPPFHAAIADRPDLLWRIAFPGGEPSEPVDAETMQEWITGGQAEGGELVWRADWAEWRPVQEVFFRQ